MAHAAIDTLQYARELMEAGVPQQQAEIMARAIGYSTDHLVTSQHFDDKLESLETRIEGKLAAVESRIDGKLLALDASLSGRMATLEERMNGKFRYFAFTQAILIGGVFLPLLKNWIA